MLKRDTKDLIGGLALTGIGLYALYGSFSYDLGTPRQMGPGYFPLVISSLLILFGLILFGTSFTRRAGLPVVGWRATLAISGSVLAFALLLKTFGSIPALFATVVVSSLADPESKPLETLILAAAVSVGCWLLFAKALGMNMPPLVWPF